jgi:predicted alpha/beta-hydrolase family hydrolase
MEFLEAGPADAETTLLLAPGAGAPANSGWMEHVSALLADAELRVLRFDFDYMAARQRTGSRRPPPRGDALKAEYEAAVRGAAARARGKLAIGGKSLGGRVASLVAQPLFDAGTISGLVCLGYPFHPPKQPDTLRTAHLVDLTCPALIVQGARDPFGGPDEVAGYGLSRAIDVHWVRDGDHDLKPRRSSGATHNGNLADAARAIAAFCARLR